MSVRQSVVSHMVEFKKSPEWLVIQAELKKRVVELHESLESFENSREEDIVCKARIDEIRQLLDLPDDIIAEVDEKESDDEVLA